MVHLLCKYLSVHFSRLVFSEHLLCILPHTMVTYVPLFSFTFHLPHSLKIVSSWKTDVFQLYILSKAYVLSLLLRRLNTYYPNGEMFDCCTLNRRHYLSFLKKDKNEEQLSHTLLPSILELYSLKITCPIEELWSPSHLFSLPPPDH